VTEGPYTVVEVPPRECIDCRRGAKYRVVDSRKKHGERYPRPLRCLSCARAAAARYNREVQPPQTEGS